MIKIKIPSTGVKKGGNASMFADPANVDAPVREWCGPHENTYLNLTPEGRSGRTPRSGTIAKIVIFAPLSEGPKAR